MNTEKSKEIEEKIQEVKKEREILQNVLGLQESFLTHNLKHSKSDMEIRSNAPLKFKSSLNLKNKDLELEEIMIEYVDENLLDALSPKTSKVRSPFGSSVNGPFKKKLEMKKPHVRNKSLVQVNNNSSAKSNLGGISIESFDIFK